VEGTEHAIEMGPKLAPVPLGQLVEGLSVPRSGAPQRSILSAILSCPGHVDNTLAVTTPHSPQTDRARSVSSARGVVTGKQPTNGRTT
jgi:hypothetical protein